MGGEYFTSKRLAGGSAVFSKSGMSLSEGDLLG